MPRSIRTRIINTIKPIDMEDPFRRSEELGRQHGCHGRRPCVLFIRGSASRGGTSISRPTTRLSFCSSFLGSPSSDWRHSNTRIEKFVAHGCSLGRRGVFASFRAARDELALKQARLFWSAALFRRFSCFCEVLPSHQKHDSARRYRRKSGGKAPQSKSSLV